MPANRNALIRYKAIDQCLTNRQKRWTLDMLIEKVSDILYEYEGMDKGISRRTIQADIQMMRSDKLGYNAPIIIVDKKFYTYENPEYSITNIPLSENDLSRLNEAVEMLKQFKGFSHFKNLNEVVQKLESHVYAASSNERPAIHLETNENLKGIGFLDTIYHAIVHAKALKIGYQSFTARETNYFFFHAWWLKEFKNRWFVVGTKGNAKEIYTLALDRMSEIEISETETYRADKTHTPDEYYKNVIGVSVSPTLRPVEVLVWISAPHAPYVLTKPLHASQKLIETKEDRSVIIRLNVQLNFELEREIMGFGEGMVVLAPERLRKNIKNHFKAATIQYQTEDVEYKMASQSVSSPPKNEVPPQIGNPE